VIHLQNAKFVGVTPPAAIIDNAAATTNVIDTLGFDHCRIYVYLGALDIAAVTLKVQEADAKSSATALTSGADVTGLTYGTSTNLAGSVSALPSATDDNTVYVFDIDLRARKRYLDVSLTLGDGAAGSYVTVFAILSRPEQAPTTAAGQGCADVLAV
jgi:hypothetical protein